MGESNRVTSDWQVRTSDNVVVIYRELPNWSSARIERDYEIIGKVRNERQGRRLLTKAQRIADKRNARNQLTERLIT